MVEAFSSTIIVWIWTINSKDRRRTGGRKEGRYSKRDVCIVWIIPIEIFSFIHINGNSGGQFEWAFPLTFSISLQSSVKSSLFLTMKRKWWQIHFSLAALKVDKTTIGSRLLSCFVENWQLRAFPYLICTILRLHLSYGTRFKLYRVWIKLCQFGTLNCFQNCTTRLRLINCKLYIYIISIKVYANTNLWIIYERY